MKTVKVEFQQHRNFHGGKVGPGDVREVSQLTASALVNARAVKLLEELDPILRGPVVSHYTPVTETKPLTFETKNEGDSGQSEKPILEEEPEKKFPVHVGGGYYELSNGERVRGKENAEKEESAIKEV
jgi:hypothetical protein